MAPALVAGAHAAVRLARPPAGPLGSLLLDVTLFGMLVTAAGDVPQAEIAAIAYVAAAALLMLPPRHAATVLGGQARSSA